jgi:hypothetical protein
VAGGDDRQAGAWALGAALALLGASRRRRSGRR